MNKTTIVVENTLIFLFILLLLPFPKIIEEILIGSLFAVCFINCFLDSKKFIKRINKIFSYSIPYITILTLLVQIHSVRFSLVENDVQKQLLCVQLYNWITDKLYKLEAFHIGALIYFWLLLYFLILFLENGLKSRLEVINKFNQDRLNVQKQNIAYKKNSGIISEEQVVIENNELHTRTELNEDIVFSIKKIRNYLVGSFVVCVCHFGSGMIKDMMFEKLCFEEAFFNNAVIAVGSSIPFHQKLAQRWTQTQV